MRFRLLAAVCAFLWICSATFAQQRRSSSTDFSFSRSDLDYLAYCNQLDQNFEQRHLVYEDPDLTRYVTAVGTKPLPAGAAPENVHWRFRVLKEPLPNAFALANGSIYVNTGMLALLENEAQLASVLAHEETHVLNRHNYFENRDLREKTKTMEVLAAIAAGGSSFGGLYGWVAGGTLNGVSSAVMVSAIYGYSRELEREADVRAVTAVVEAGYSPEQMAAAFRLFDSPHEVDLSHSFYQDHPRLAERITYVSALAATANPTGKELAIESEPYVAATQQVTRDNIAWDIDQGRQRTAVAEGRKLVAEDQRTSANFRVLGDAWYALGARTPDPTPQELSSRRKGNARKVQQKFTFDEYDSQQMATPEGQTNWRTNSKEAEAAYRKALELDPANENAHRGLGLLYEKEQLPGKAAAEFQQYLDATKEPADEAQIRHRLELAKAQTDPHPEAAKP